MKTPFANAPVRVSVVNSLTQAKFDGVSLARSYGSDWEKARQAVREDLTAVGFTVLNSHHHNVLVARRDGLQLNVRLWKHCGEDAESMNLASSGDITLAAEDVGVIQRGLNWAIQEAKLNGPMRRQLQRQLRQRTLRGAWAKKIALKALSRPINLQPEERRVPGFYNTLKHRQAQIKCRLLRAAVPDEPQQTSLPDVLMAKLEELRAQVPSARTNALNKVAALEALITGEGGDVGVAQLLREAAFSAAALHQLQCDQCAAHHTAIGYDTESETLMSEGMVETDRLFERIVAALFALHGRSLPEDDSPLSDWAVNEIKWKYVRLDAATFDAAVAPFIQPEPPPFDPAVCEQKIDVEEGFATM